MQYAYHENFIFLQDDSALPLLAITSSCIEFNQDYELKVTLITKSPPRLGKKVTVKLAEYAVVGIVTAIAGPYDTYLGANYKLTINSLLNPLKTAINSRVFIGKNVIEIISAILELHNIAYKFSLNEDFPAIDFVQLEESDFACLLRLASNWGLLFNPTLELIEFTTIIKPSVSKKLNYNLTSSNSGLEVMAMQLEYQLLPKQVIINDVEGALASCHSQSEVQAYGTFYSIETSAPNNTYMADGKINYYDSRREILTIVSCDVIALGSMVDFTCAIDSSLNGIYYVFAIKLFIEQSTNKYGAQTNTALASKNIISLTRWPNLKPQAPLYHYHNEHRLVNLEPWDHNQNNLGANGEYLIRYPFDNISPRSLSSAPVWQLQPYGAAKSAMGWHLPNNCGAVVAIIYLNGDCNKPYIVGSKFFANNVVTLANANEKVIRTKEKQLIKYETIDLVPTITLANQANKLVISKERVGEIALSSQGQIELCAKKQLNIVTKDYLAEVIAAWQLQSKIANLSSGQLRAQATNWQLVAKSLSIQSNKLQSVSTGSKMRFSRGQIESELSLISSNKLQLQATHLQIIAPQVIIQGNGCSLTFSHDTVHWQVDGNMEFFSQTLLLTGKQKRQAR